VGIGDGWGTFTKQGSSMLRFLLVEAAQVTVRSVPEWRSKYLDLMMRRGRKIAKVAMARRRHGQRVSNGSVSQSFSSAVEDLSIRFLSFGSQDFVLPLRPTCACCR
jgi:hypothetical protein